MIRWARRLRRDRRGATLVEFALLTPVMLLMLMGMCDLLHRVWIQGVLDGEMQKVGRDSALEGGPLKAAEIDARMKKMESMIAYGATIDVTRQTFSTFLAIKPERFDDLNGNGVRDRGECFDDVNGNKAWDLKPGRAGQGGANDVTVIRAVVKYPRMFPVASFLGWDKTLTLASETALKNQPFAAQAAASSEPICT